MLFIKRLLNGLQVIKDRSYKLINDNKLVLSLFVLITLNSLIWNIAIPIWQTPDELAHFSYVQSLVEHKFFPLKEGNVLVSKETSLATNTLKFNEVVFNSEEKFLFNDYEERKALLDSNMEYRGDIESEITSAANYPPLYYMLCSIPYLIFRNCDLPTLFHSIRFTSTILLVITCYFVYKTAKVLQFNKSLQVASCIFVGFQPMLTMLSASVNPDNLIITLFSIFTYLVIKVITHVNISKLQDIYIMLLVLFLTILTKEYSFVMSGLVIFFLFYYLYKKKRIGELNMIKFIPIFVLMIFFVILQLKILSFDTGVKSIAMNTGSSILSFPKFLFSKDYIDRLVSFEFQSFWGVFGWLDTPIHAPFYDIIWIFVLITVIGILSELFSRRQRLTVFCFMSIFFISLVVFLAFLDFRIHSIYESMITQGRYYLVMIAPITILFVIGWEKLHNMLRKQITFLPSLISYLCILFNSIALIWFILPRYYITI